MTQVIRAIWPSYLNIPNHLPESAGITTQQMISHFLFWSVQFPILLIPPHKLRWFFVFKTVIVLTAATGTVIGMTQLASGTGTIWEQQPTVSGSTRAWLIVSSMSSMTVGWATMATNVADFIRYMKTPRGVYWQALFVPGICTLLGVYGIIGTSASKVIYGEVSDSRSQPVFRGASFRQLLTCSYSTSGTPSLSHPTGTVLEAEQLPSSSVSPGA